MKKRPVKKPVIDQAEWDFRQITNHELEAAIRFEYCRSVPGISGLITEWLGAEVSACEIDERNKVRWIDGSTTVRDVLRLYLENPACSDLLDLAGSEMPSALGWLSFDFYQCVLFGACFSKPWITLPESLRAAFSLPTKAAIVEDITEDFLEAAFDRDVEKSQTDFELERFRRMDATLGEKCRVFSIDWGASDSNIIQGFKRWLSDHPRPHPPHKAKRGRAGTPPYARLRWLSAYRLHAANFNFAGAASFIKQTAVGEDENAVLPTFDSTITWSAAVADAKNHMRKLVPFFNPESVPIIG